MAPTSTFHSQAPAGASRCRRPAADGDGFFAHHGPWAPGVRLFRNLTFTAKAAIVSLAFLLPLLALLGWQLHQQSRSAWQARQDATRQHVEIAHGVIAWAHAQERSGRLSREQAQATAKAAVAALRYEGAEYFWINDYEPRVVMHPIKPELDGRAVGDLKDANGFALFRAFVETARRDGKGFVPYVWPRPGSEQPVDKLSYVMAFEPWGWVVGSGIYVDDLRAATWRAIRLDGAIVAGVLLLAGYLFASFYRVMNGGLQETRRHLRAMTAGDLTTSPSPWGSDDAAQLMLELRAMQASLRGMVQGMRRSSQEIVHASSEIASGARDLSARTEQTAANLQQTAASMEQIGSTVQHTSAHTAQASESAQGNARTAAEGGAVMQEVVRTMEGIRESSSRIADIIGTIDGIAFQTNILALNAAVEAARAGEQGRGFAVVAGEVRMLAQRSAEAARQIKALIQDSVDQIEGGTGVVRQAGGTMDHIVGSSQRVSDLLGEIATGAREQSQGIAQIGAAVQDLDRMTQQNAALVEQTAAAAASMKARADELASQVARFRLPADEGGAVETAGDAAPPPVDFDFDAAIDAHRQWKVRLRQAIAAQGQLDAENLCRDDRCPLGHWLHGDGQRRWGGRPVFVALVDKHAAFHREAGAVARRINAGAYDDAERLIGSGSDFARVSNEVTQLLTQARRER